MRATDVAIAGGGLIGLLTAYMLTEVGLSVRLLETGEAGREASWAGGGILWPIYPWRYPEAVQVLAQRGRRLYPALCEALYESTGIDPEYRETGLLLLDQGERAAALHWCDEHDEPVQILDASGMGSHQPGLGTSAGALYLPRIAQVRNPRLCRALVRALRQRGVVIEERTPATGIAARAGRFQGLQAADGLRPAGIGVIAAGAWSGRLLPGLDVYPVKGQMLLLRGGPGLVRHILLRDGDYVIPRADGRILVGSTVEETGFDKAVDAGVRQSLASGASATLPALGRLPLEAHWAGLRPATADGVPFIGRVPEMDGLYVNTGQYRNGVVNAPSSARLLAQMIRGDADPGAGNAYRLDRSW